MKTNIIHHLLNPAAVIYDSNDLKIEYTYRWRDWQMDFCLRDGDSDFDFLEVIKGDYGDGNLTDTQKEIIFEFAKEELEYNINNFNGMEYPDLYE